MVKSPKIVIITLTPAARDFNENHWIGENHRNHWMVGNVGDNASSTICCFPEQNNRGKKLRQFSPNNRQEKRHIRNEIKLLPIALEG
jgi:hypothetical protein